MTSLERLERISVSGGDGILAPERTSAHPLVSIVIPTKNRCELLEQALDSIHAQTYSNWEVIVVDDGSTDRTADLVQRHRKQDQRVRWIVRPENEPAGGSACRNFGFARATGEYTIFLDSDDILTAGCLERRIVYLQQHPEPDFVVFQAEAFERLPGDLSVLFNVPRPQPDLDRLLQLDHPWQTSGPIWRSSALKRIGGWDASLPSWQDWELNIRAICEGLKYEKVNYPDYYFRRTPSTERTNSRQRNDPAHLNAAISLFGKISDKLNRTGNMNVERKKALGGLAFLVVMRLNWDHGFGLGIGAWRRAYQQRLIGLANFILGSIVLASLKPPLVRSVAWRTSLMWFRRHIHWKSKKIML
jgi:glycosyltransferase involved in cell wall biosynthesis